MSTLTELLDVEDRLWRALCARFAKVTGDDWTRPGVNGDWSPKDVLMHIAAWHAVTTDRFECLRTQGTIGEPPDVDTFNAESVERNRDLSLADARAIFESARHRFREEAALLEEPLAERTIRVFGSNGQEHYEEHIPQLDAFLEGR